MRRDIGFAVATALALVGAIAAVPRPSASAPSRDARATPTLTTEEEAALGWLAAPLLTARLGGEARADDSLARRVAAMGTRLAGTATVRAAPWRFAFHLLENAAPLAFALPGGEVFVSRGMLGIVGRDDLALSALLAHQMGHVLARHGAPALASDSTARALLVTLDAPATDQRHAAHVALAAVERTRLDRDAEPEADALAARLLHEAGLDAAASIRILHVTPSPAAGPFHGDPGARTRREQRLAGLVKQLK